MSTPHGTKKQRIYKVLEKGLFYEAVFSGRQGPAHFSQPQPQGDRGWKVAPPYVFKIAPNFEKKSLFLFFRCISFEKLTLTFELCESFEVLFLWDMDFWVLLFNKEALCRYQFEPRLPLSWGGLLRG
jgi:hypothetical protein